MNRSKLTKPAALRIARGMKNRLLAEGIPVEHVYLFGSVAAGRTHRWSDLDIAFICRPFGSDRTAEYATVAQTREDFDIPMDLICLHPEDMENPYSSIVQEVKRNGIEV